MTSDLLKCQICGNKSVDEINRNEEHFDLCKNCVDLPHMYVTSISDEINKICVLCGRQKYWKHHINVY